MDHAATLARHRPGLHLPAWRSALQRAWQVLTRNADERFLRDATDLADLERRLRQLERGRAERFWPLGRDA